MPKTPPDSVLARIRAALALAEGDARTRTLDLDEVLAVLRRAKRQGWATSGREKVPSSYRYQAWATCAEAFRWQGKLYLIIDRKHTGASGPLGFTSIGSRWHRRTQADHAARAAAGWLHRGGVHLCSTTAIPSRRARGIELELRHMFEANVSTALHQAEANHG